MKDYYQILRVGRHASEMEIKRAYRRLAIVFHPDKNPSEEASALFQEINEAHEVLLDTEKRAQYDLLLRGDPRVEQQSQRGWHRDPAYRRQHTAKRRPTPRPPEHLLMMAHLLRYFRSACFVGMGWCGFLVFDYLLPHRIYEETVLSESERIYGWRFDHVPNVVVTDKVHQFRVAHEGVEYFPTGSIIKVNTSRILNLVIKVESEGARYTIYGLDTVYQNYLFAPIILFIVSLIGLTMKTGIEFRFSFGVLICMALLINFVFLLFSIL